MSQLFNTQSMIKALIKGQTLVIKSLSVGQQGPHQELRCIFDEDRGSRSTVPYWNTEKLSGFVFAVILTSLTCAFWPLTEKDCPAKIRKFSSINISSSKMGSKLIKNDRFTWTEQNNFSLKDINFN